MTKKISKAIDLIFNRDEVIEILSCAIKKLTAKTCADKHLVFCGREFKKDMVVCYELRLTKWGIKIEDD